MVQNSVMKPNIDLNSPIVKMAIALSRQKAGIALNTKQTVEKAVIPIYHVPAGKRLAQIGSGVLLKIKNEYFILSASHVFDQIGTHCLLTGDGTNSPIQQLVGERFSTPRGPSEKHTDDPLDASAYHILSPLSDTFKSYAITMDDFDDTLLDYPDSVFLSAGFRVKKSNMAHNKIKSEREAFPSFEIQESDYDLLKLDPSLNIALWHEYQMLLENNWQISPIPRGFSGGAIIRIFHDGNEYKQVLTGIVTEHRKKSKDIEGVLIGTRINVHMSAILKFMPELFDEE